MKNELNEAIQRVSRAISNRTTLPILAGIKMDADINGLTLTASDTEISIRNFTPTESNDNQIIELERPGSIVVPAKFFVEIIRKLPEQFVEIEVLDNYKTMIRSGTAEIQIVGLDPEEFPLLPEIDQDNKISIYSQSLKSMIRQTVFAVSNNESTPVLTGVLWMLQADTLKFVATDRHRLATCELQLPEDFGQPFDQVVIPGKAMNELYRLLPDESTRIDIVMSDNQVLFQMDDILFYSRILEGVYPDTSKIIPQNFKTELVIDTKTFTDALDRAYLLSREEKTNIVHLVTHDENEIEISSSLSELGRIRETCTPEHLTGDFLKIAFNSKYMLDALKVIESEKIDVCFTGTMSPIVIKPVDRDEMLHLILPYRTSN